MKTRFWPVKVEDEEGDFYNVTICGRGDKDRLLVKKSDCKPFEPSPDMQRGQNAEWKKSYNAALAML